MFSPKDWIEPWKIKLTLNTYCVIYEAKVLGIPTFGIIDTNTDPAQIDFPIPANDDSVKTIQLIVNYISEEIAEVQGKSSVDNLPEDKVDEGINVVEENRKVELKE